MGGASAGGNRERCGAVVGEGWCGRPSRGNGVRAMLVHAGVRGRVIATRANP